jgi:peptide/nickel transport system substrate-binding protein
MGANYWKQTLSERMKRRRLLKMGASLSIGGVALALVGCGDDDDDNGTGGEPTSATAATATPDSSQPKTGGTLRLALPTDLATLDPHFINRDNYDSIWHVWNRPTGYNSNLEPQPQLIESWDINPENTEFVLHLREGVTWHTDRPFTSDDIEWNILRVRDPEVGVAQLRGMSNWFSGIEKPDPKTLILRSDTPRPAIFDFFELFNQADPETMESSGPSQPTGTGPFRFEEWNQGVSLQLVKNPNYWDSGKPFLDGITWSLAIEGETMVSQLEAGALDGIKAAPLRAFKRLQQDDKYQALIHPARQRAPTTCSA